MPRPRLPIQPHLTPDQIAKRYRSCRDGLEKTHWQVLWLLTREQPAPSPAQVAPMVGMTPGWIRTLIRRWNDIGPDALGDQRQATKGRKPKLNPEHQAELFTRLQSPPPDGGLWSGPKVAAYVKEQYGLSIVKQTGWVWLKRLGFTLQVPRPKNPGAATAEEIQDWKRRLGPSPGRASPHPAEALGRVVGRG